MRKPFHPRRTPRARPRWRSATARGAVLAVLLTLPATGLVAARADPTPGVESWVSVLTEGLARPGFEERVTSGVDVDAVGFTWTGASAGAVEFRVGTGGAWTSWTRVEGDQAEGPDPGSSEHRGLTSAGPVWVGSAGNREREVEVRVAEGELTGLRVHALQADRGDDDRFAIRPAGADPAWPNVISRAQWGADDSWRPRTGACRNGAALYAPNVRYAILHHTDTAGDYPAEDVPAILRAIYRFHVFTNGWCDFGYNLVVDRFGRSYEGRAGGVDRAVVGAHAAGFNTASTGVAMLGQFQGNAVPQAMYDGLKRLMVWKLFRHGVDPRATQTVREADDGDSTTPLGPDRQLFGITGHRDVGSTLCPGNLGHALLPSLRNEVQQVVTNTQPYPLEGRVVAANGPGLLTVDAHGGVHPVGAQPTLVQSAYWPNLDVVRAAVRQGSGGYVLDSWGALHPFGGMPLTSFSAYWVGWDIARSVAPYSGLLGTGGWVLSGWGSLHPYGGAPWVTNGPFWPGWDIARDVVTQPGQLGGYVLSGWGSIHPFGGAPPVVGTGYWDNWDIARAIALRPDGVSGYVLSGWGSIHPFGGAPAVTGTYWTPGRDGARDLALTADGNGGWVVDSDGKLWPFGNAQPLTPSHTWTGTNLGRDVI